MPNRNMIKWLPFNSVISNKQIIKEILKEKNKIKKPILSEEQKNLIEKKLVTAFFEQEKIKVDYFYNGQIFSITSKVKKIDFNFHKIYFDKQVLLFEQIIQVN